MGGFAWGVLAGVVLLAGCNVCGGEFLGQSQPGSCGAAPAEPDAGAAEPASSDVPDSSAGCTATVTGDAGDSSSLGPAAAKVVVTEFGDFECPYCGEEEPIVEEMLRDYAGRIRFVFTDFPLTAIHPHAELAAEAALAAEAQGAFWPYHDLLYAHQSALVRGDLEAYASTLCLDMVTFDAALEEHLFAGAVAADVAAGTSMGVDGTPTFFVNGVVIDGAVPYSQL